MNTSEKNNDLYLVLLTYNMYVLRLNAWKINLQRLNNYVFYMFCAQQLYKLK